MDTFILSIFVFGLLCCPSLASELSLLPFMLRVRITGAVLTLLFGLCLSIFLWVADFNCILSLFNEAHRKLVSLIIDVFTASWT